MLLDVCGGLGLVDTTAINGQEKLLGIPGLDLYHPEKNLVAV